MTTFKTSLHDEKTFYQSFLKDLNLCKEELIIESPFITSERMKSLWPSLKRLHSRGVKIYIITRNPKEHNDGYDSQSETEIEALEVFGIQVFLCTGNPSSQTGNY